MLRATVFVAEHVFADSPACYEVAKTGEYDLNLHEDSGLVFHFLLCDHAAWL